MTMLSFLNRYPNWTPKLCVSPIASVASLLIQKNGSRTIRKSLRGPNPSPFDWIIRPVSELINLKASTKFYVVRDPVDRFISLYNMIQVATPSLGISLDDLISYAQGEMGRTDCDPHIRPQSDFIAFLPNDGSFQKVQMSNLSSYLSGLGLTVQTVGVSTSSFVPTSAQISTIQSMYSKDANL